ncbi:MAG: hypothetical protein GX793_00635 [Bacteroidales bacterium]|jgi:uncharacterized protein (TIGR02145 family)|nr:hypothetical protein [Bacteroidales bacterium]NLB85547.1 hypothetical protein [Bacteroidales bacterium]
MNKRKVFLIQTLMILGVFLLSLISCNTKKSEDSFTDERDGNVYKIVQIGEQTWMAENLKYLPSVDGPTTGSYTNPHYYVYAYDGNDVDKAKSSEAYQTYGVLYNWTAALQACPSGWHLPSNEEWTQLTEFLGGEGVAGGKLKSTDSINQESPNAGATNESGFNALLGGYRDYNGVFNYIKSYGFWYSASEYSSDYAWYRYLDNNNSNAFKYYSKENGLSVRCIKD